MFNFASTPITILNENLLTNDVPNQLLWGLSYMSYLGFKLKLLELG